METSWIVTADEGRARFFSESDPSKPLQEIDAMVNTAARMRTLGKISDKMSPRAAGASAHSTGGATPTNQYEPRQTPEEREAESFAKAISDYLLRAYAAGQFQKLDLFAAPKFLGMLRMLLDPQLKPLVSLEVNKDYTHLSAHQLREQIHTHQRQQ
jgi:protein required for attachment to host cells